MTEDTGTRKIRKEDLLSGKKNEDDTLTGEEIEQLADLFATELPPEPEDEEDTGEFPPVKDDSGSFRPVE